MVIKEEKIFHGYMYTIKWRCVERTSFCKGTMTTSLDMTNPVPANDHNHAPDYAAILATKCINNMKRKAAETEDKPSQLYISNLADYQLR